MPACKKTLSMPVSRIKKSAFSLSGLGHFRFRKIKDQYLLTNDWGRYLFVSKKDFEHLQSSRLDPSHLLHAQLKDKGFIENQGERDKWEDVYRSRNLHLFKGPLLHIFVLTLRCDHRCIYCQAGRRPMNADGFDMSPETASLALKTAVSSPSPSLTIEFQGGEPLANFERVEQIVKEARAIGSGKTVYFTIVTSLSLMDEKKLRFLLDNRVQICTSLDGPRDLHDANRPRKKPGSYEHAIRWMDKINEAYASQGLDPDLANVGTILTVTKDTLKRGRDVVDEYVKRGQKVIHLRPLQPFGFAEKAWKKQNYSAEQFLDFYEEAFEHILDLNRKGVEILEKTASLFLTAILTDRDSNYMDLRSPCGAGIGQLAYNYDGKVYICDEGRMVGSMGDDMFCIGNVYESSYEEIIRHPGVRSVCLASCLEGLPGCTDCAYQPYCGVCPVYSYITQGDLFPHVPQCNRCLIQKGILDILFRHLAEDEESVKPIFERWTIHKDRSSIYTGGRRG